MTESKKPFDPVATLERWNDYWRRFPQFNKGSRLDFRQRCAVYACLHQNMIPQMVVCRMFNISRATVSYIAGCRNDDRQPVTIEAAGYSETIGGEHNLTKGRDKWRRPRYQDVADEFDRLGQDEFMRVYYTPEIHARMRQVRQQVTGKIYLE